jgi:hypothetical protein
MMIEHDIIVQVPLSSQSSPGAHPTAVKVVISGISVFDFLDIRMLYVTCSVPKWTDLTI